MTAVASQSLRPLLARCLPFGLYIVFLALNPWLTAALPGVDPRWWYGVQIALVLAALVVFRRDYSELRASAPVRRNDWLLTLLLGVAVFVVWINLDFGWAVIGEGKAGFVPLTSEGGLDWPFVVLRIFGAAAVVPIMEELFWRSFVQRWVDQQDFLALAPAAVSWKALLLTSLVFGFEHGQWLAGVVAGVAYGWLYRRTGSLWPAILAHAVTNFMLGVWVVHSGQWQFW